MSKYIVDFQAYNQDHSFIIKELTIIELNSENVDHFLVEPPFDRTILSYKEQKKVLWLENNHHKIKWEDGDVEYSKLFADFCETIGDADIIYVKGSEKALFGQNVLGKFTIDLDKLDCPKACSLPIPELWNRLTGNYSTHSDLSGVCLLLQALKFKEWLTKLFQQGVDKVDV